MEEVAEVLEEEGGVEEVEEALEDFSTLTLFSCSVFCACRCIEAGSMAPRISDRKGGEGHKSPQII
jgi:hypothetical protein